MFDNQFFAYHLPIAMAEEYVRPELYLTKTYDFKFCFVLDIPGVNNADTYYLDNTSRSQFVSLSLASLSDELGLGNKMDMPTLAERNTGSAEAMIGYCSNDCRMWSPSRSLVWPGHGRQDSLHGVLF